MLNLFIALLFATMMGEYYFISVRVEDVAYALDNISPAIIQSGVYLLSDPPYFDDKALYTAINDYLAIALPKYTTGDYELTLEYYDSGTEDYCTFECGKVVITIDVKVSFFYTYSKSMYYEISGGIY